MQCSVLATVESIQDAVLNISTSAQIAFVAQNFQPSNDEPTVSSVEYFPYFNDKFLAVAASLNGGNALATFVRMLQQWTMELGFSVPQCKITNSVDTRTLLSVYFIESAAKVWEKIMALSLEDGAVSNLKIQPTLLGERHMPQLTASVSNIDIGNLGLGQVFRALCNGLLQNLHRLVTRLTSLAFSSSLNIVSVVSTK